MFGTNQEDVRKNTTKKTTKAKQALTKENRGPTKAKRAPTRKPSDDIETESTTSVSSVVTDGQNTSSDISLSDLINPHLSDEEEDNTAATENFNMSTGPMVKKESVNQYVAILYTEPKLKYYWGKIVQTVECDKTNKTKQIKVQFLKQKAIGSNPKDWTWHEPLKAEVEVLDVEYVLYGPLLPSVKSKIFTFPDSDAYARLLQYGVDEHL